MVKVKLLELFDIKFNRMEQKINKEIDKLKDKKADIKEVKFIGDSLQKSAVFIVYE